ncbi:leucine-rich repeat-containing protein [Candidatus Magnetomorum sp. HK-1]|nr:leucine-rich repeat-containing protein [Candidatus Magnetomorum sp. HK-1]
MSTQRTKMNPYELKALEKIEDLISEKISIKQKLEKKMSLGNNACLLDDNASIIGLNIWDNQISDLSALKELKNLTQIYLSSNQISDLSALKELKNLTLINLSYNQIKKLPEYILNLNLDIHYKEGYFEGINLYNNPLENPSIEIIKQGNEAIKSYFESLKGEQQPLNEVKVLLVGYGGAGKTSLVKKIFNENIDGNESKTNGIKIRDLNIQTGDKDVLVHFWDFGGQEIMHSTHQFFLSKRSLYVLVLDDRKEDNEEYWLKLIESFGGNSPILIALNKMDENPSFDVNRKFLLEKYKGVKEFIRISCKDGKGINEFNEKLKKHLLNVEILETTWAKSWFNVKEKLQDMTNHYISYEYYKNICENENVKKQEHQKTLVTFLNDLGVIVYFSDLELCDTNVLNPEWVTNAVYKIINSNQLAENKGVLDINSLSEILTIEDCPREKQQYVVNLMKKFELCYEIDKHTVLLPDLLDKQEPEFNFAYDDALRLTIKYDYLPKSVLPRCIVKLNTYIKDKLNWRTGVVLENKPFDSTAIIKADVNDKKIDLYITGRQKREFLSMIRGTFNIIHKKFEKLTVYELIPVPGYEDYTIEYDELIGYELENKKEFFIGKLRKSFDVQFLLNRIVKKEERAKSYHDKEQTKYETQQTQTLNTNITSKVEISIFLASSKELKPEREGIDLLISSMNRSLHKKGIFLNLVMWEEQGHAFNDTRKQEDFNKKMLNCDVVIVLFYKKIGEFTREEFSIAYENLKQGEKPNFLYVYFKKFDYTETSPDDLTTILELQREIESYGQFIKYFKEIDDLKYDLQNQLDIIVNLSPLNIINQIYKKNYEIFTMVEIPFDIIYQVEKIFDAKNGDNNFFKLINDLFYGEAKNNLDLSNALSKIIMDYYYDYKLKKNVQN